MKLLDKEYQEQAGETAQNSHTLRQRVAVLQWFIPFAHDELFAVVGTEPQRQLQDFDDQV